LNRIGRRIIRPAPLCVMLGGGLLSSCLQLADFAAVSANGGFPQQPAVDVTGAGNASRKKERWWFEGAAPTAFATNYQP